MEPTGKLLRPATVENQLSDNAYVAPSSKAVKDALSKKIESVPRATTETLGTVREAKSINDSLGVVNGNLVANNLIIGSSLSSPTVNDLETKLVVKTTGVHNMTAMVITRRARGMGGYVGMGFDNNATPPDGGNIGGASPYRPTAVLNIPKCIVGRFTPYRKSDGVVPSQLGVDSIQRFFGTEFIINRYQTVSLNEKDVGLTAKDVYVLKGDGSSIIYAFTGTARNRTIRLGLSPSSSTSVKLSLTRTDYAEGNWEELKTISCRASSSGYIDIDLPFSSYNSFIKVEVTERNPPESPLPVPFCYVIGCDIKDLKDADPLLPIDDVYWSTGNVDFNNNNAKYINGGGANEFAARLTSTGKWMGTFHGGHSDFTQRLQTTKGRYNIDTNLNALPMAHLTSHAHIMSLSTIDAEGAAKYKYTANTSFFTGGSTTSYCVEQVSGSPQKFTRLMSNMCCTSPTFTWTMYPINLKDIPKNSETNVGATEVVHLYNAPQTMNLVNTFTRVPFGANVRNGVYIWSNNTYTKVYTPLILDKVTEWTGGAFITTKEYF